MDGPETGLIKWSPNPAHDLFLHANIQHGVVQVYEATGRAHRGRFDHRKVSKHNDLPALTTFDWSPSMPGIVAVGSGSGVVSLLRVDDDSNAYLNLGLKLSRACQAVAFNKEGKLAVGLDRVRSDNCLQIWDVSRLSSLASVSSGFAANVAAFREPWHLLEPSLAVASIKFFEDNPNVLVAGVRSQGLRIHDLREGHGAVASFATKCCNNLAIDYADQNYFASSALDQPGVMVWDRRASQRHRASPAYAEACGQNGLPWGAVLQLDGAMASRTDAAMKDSKRSFIRAMRFSRDHAGLLAVLARTGQLKLLTIKREHTAAKMRLAGSPELLEVRRSHEIDPLQTDASGRKNKIVSFDWITLDSPVVRARLLVLRANGLFEVLEKPSTTSDYAFKLIPWQVPHRGCEDNSGDYHMPVKLEPMQNTSIYGPLVTEQALSDVALFGREPAKIRSLVEQALDPTVVQQSVFQDDAAADEPHLHQMLQAASSVSQKLHRLGLALQETKQHEDGNRTRDRPFMKQAQDPQPNWAREWRHDLRSASVEMFGLSRTAAEVLDHVKLLRAREKYLFNYETNKHIVADDAWLQDAWGWVAGADDAAADGGMMSHPLDISYMGVQTLWAHDLGSKPHSRLSDKAFAPDEGEWEDCMRAISRKLGLRQYGGVPTRRPGTRAVCLEICNWGKPRNGEHQGPPRPGFRTADALAAHTMAAADALFRGETDVAITMLQDASSEHAELLFVSLALQLAGDGTKKALDFDVTTAAKQDPYLRAVSAYIATGDWAMVANQDSLPMRDRIMVALRNFDDGALTAWLQRQVASAVQTGNVEAIVLTGITDPLVDVLARYVRRFHDYQTATLLLSVCAPRFVDDLRAAAFRSAYQAYLQRHCAFVLRAKFDVESTKKSKHYGRPTLLAPPSQVMLRCVYCDAAIGLEHDLGKDAWQQQGPKPQHRPRGATVNAHPVSPPPSSATRTVGPASSSSNAARRQTSNSFTDKVVGAGISCPTCKRHLPRCVVCLEVVGVPRSGNVQIYDDVGSGGAKLKDTGARLAAKFPSFCLQCEHVMHFDHARQWFARHGECAVPECRCRCSWRGNDEVLYD